MGAIAAPQQLDSRVLRTHAWRIEKSWRPAIANPDKPT
jgi:hypothetical protein